MKMKAIKNKKPSNHTPSSASLANASITKAIKQLTSGPNIPVATVQLPASQEASKSPEPVAYKMRVECYEDGVLIHDMLGPYLECWQEQWETFEVEGKEFKGPGVEVRFGITPGTLTLQNLQSLFHCIPDCHVAEETVALERSYTGERKEVGGSELKVPQKAMIQPMVHRVESARHYRQIMLRRTESLHAMLEGVASSGSLPHMSREGFIMLLEHKPSGITSIRRVSAVTGVADPVKDRLVLLQQ
ncbi:hypothetical protein LP414_09250 [Polaromonas sp. P1(28)-13]|nr:hypothetical protein LP414_09250 [Polaromonas sp. P1(28)-13]